MRIRVLVWLAVQALAAGGCTSNDRYSGLDGKPGGYVTGSSPFQRTMSGLNPVSDYNEQWTLVRIVAPPGATHCRITGQSPFASDGPMTEGKPDARRELMLTYDAGAKTAAVACRTGSGVVERKVVAVPYAMMYRDRAVHTVQVKPPLVHVDPADPDAERRWSELAAELCPVVSERAFGFVCKPGMLAKLKAADLGRP